MPNDASVVSFCPFVGKNAANKGFYARKNEIFHPYATIIPPPNS